MANEPESEWWLALVGRATDHELEQACSQLGGNDEMSTSDYLMMLSNMHDATVAELGRRSREVIKNEQKSLRYCDAPVPVYPDQRSRDSFYRTCGYPLNDHNCPNASDHLLF